MEVIHERVAGLDVHKDSVVACVRIPRGARRSGSVAPSRRRRRGFRRCWRGSRNRGLHSRGDGGDRGLLEAGVEHPERGRLRTDRGQRRPHQERPRPQDRRQRRHLDRRSPRLRPDPGELRSDGEATWELRLLLTRTRKQLVRDQTSHVQRIQKTLTEANIKLDPGHQRYHRPQRTADDKGDDRAAFA